MLDLAGRAGGITCVRDFHLAFFVVSAISALATFVLLALAPTPARRCRATAARRNNLSQEPPPPPPVVHRKHCKGVPRVASKIEDPLPKTVEGSAGETHQVAGGDDPVLTTAQGIPVSDDQNSLKIGRARPDAARGLPLPREDLPLRPRAHPRARRPCPRLRRARLSSRPTSRSPTSPAPTSSSAPARRPPAFVRFSTVAGNKGSADLARDVRGFAVKLYTKEGNWDLVGNNIPVFFIQDAIKFPDLIHAAKPEPDRGFPAGADRARQFLGLHLA